MTPQFMHNRRATFSEAVTARIGHSGRCLEISLEVKPVSVRLMTALAPTWAALDRNPALLDIGGQFGHIEGIDLVQHYAYEWMRIRAQSVSPELEQAQKLLDWLHGREGSLISLPDIYQKGPKNLRSKNEALASVMVLVSHGWLIPVPEGDTIDGQFRRDVWRIVRPAQ